MLKLKEKIVFSARKNGFPIVSVCRGRRPLCVGLGALDKNRKCLVLFTQCGKQIEIIDRLFFNESKNEYTMHPFAWQHFREGKSQSREHVRKRLRLLGLNPSIVDYTYPQYKGKLTNITKAGESPLFIGIANDQHSNHPKLLIFTQTKREINIIDSLELYTYSQEDIFYTSHARRKLSRIDARQHLKTLGFDPEILDRTFSPTPSQEA